MVFPFLPTFVTSVPLMGGQVSEDNKIMGVVTEGNLMACLLNGRVQPEDVVTSAMYHNFKKVGGCILRADVNGV